MKKTAEITESLKLIDQTCRTTDRKENRHKKMKKSSIATLIMIFLLIPAALFFGMKLPGKGFYLVATVVVILALVPFFMTFEKRKPTARELVVVAVLCAIAVAARAAFIWAPNFKPIFAIIMIAGFAFGPETGFLVGAISAFASNIIFGQSMYTPWQMMAYGVAGLIAGLFMNRKNLINKGWKMGIIGFLTVLILVGPLLDTSVVLLYIPVITWSTVWPTYSAGIIVNLCQAACTFVALLLIGRPFMDKLERIKIKYGMVQPVQTFADEEAEEASSNANSED